MVAAVELKTDDVVAVASKLDALVVADAKTAVVDDPMTGVDDEVVVKVGNTEELNIDVV